MPVSAGGDLGPPDAPAPDQIHIEATHPTGEMAVWLDDEWWLDVLRRWRNERVDVHVLPTPFALLHPVVLHQMDMLRRMVSAWRRIGHAYLDDLSDDDAVARAASSPYDEVRIIDAPRPGTAKSAGELRGLSFQALAGRIMRLQSAAGIVRPAVVRLPGQRAAETIPSGSEAIFTST
jgi:hypothetical protein